MASRLPNHLLAHRKRAALSQEEMAYLLGTRGGAKISRYEKFTRGPNLETVLAYEAIFGKSASELFAGMYKEVNRTVIERAKLLARRIRRQKPGRVNQRKLQVLEAILARLSK